MHSRVVKLDGEGLKLAVEIRGPDSGLPVVLFHGGGQTRGSWKNGAAALARQGYQVFSVDARGHGDSDWAPDGNYTLPAMAADIRRLLAQLPPRPALVGASLGGVGSLYALGHDDAPEARALVLVDITPRMRAEGANRVGDFMRANPDGFGSLEEVADAVSAYNPHRPRPKDLSGLKRNLREQDGRLFWHWDPAFMADGRPEPGAFEEALVSAASRLTIPTLLVRGRQSDLVTEDEVAHFRDLMPHAAYADIAGAGHMIAGDRNDAFNAAILDFLTGVDRQLA